MKRYILLFLIIPALVSCKDKLDPEGPTDVRIYNNTTYVFDNISIKTADDPKYTNVEHSFGSLNPGIYTSYYRVDVAYPKADVSLTIGGVQYAVSKVDYTYLHYMSTMKISYWITVQDAVNHVLGIEVVPEEEITDL